MKCYHDVLDFNIFKNSLVNFISTLLLRSTREHNSSLGCPVHGVSLSKFSFFSFPCFFSAILSYVVYVLIRHMRKKKITHLTIVYSYEIASLPDVLFASNATVELQ